MTDHAKRAAYAAFSRHILPSSSRAKQIDNALCAYVSASPRVVVPATEYDALCDLLEDVAKLAVSDPEDIARDLSVEHDDLTVAWFRRVVGGARTRELFSEPRRLARTRSSAPTDLEQAASALANEVYAAARSLEDLENAGLVHGNGHHLRQAVADSAVELLRTRWTGDTPASGDGDA